MCIVTEEVTGTVIARDEDWLTVQYDEPQRVQTGALLRTVFSGYISTTERNLGVGDSVLCQIQRAGSHNSEPLLAVRRIPEV